ncbi:bifunctional diguanylate cyclase/phosphodiesterase [uncultured Planococcus sp.]|uniref:sensor domain-containing protein n=1 Tax=Planococcus donghaensis TaxID=414778 RepID=UPI00261CEB30|nr:diguanylate cyclase [uncultured Planococcus sp.]
MTSEAGSLSFARILMEGIKEMVFVVKVNDNDSFAYEFLNNAVMERTLLTPASIGKTIDEVHSVKKAEFLKRKYSEVLRGNCSISYEDSYHSRANRLFYSKSLLTPFFNDEGKCTHIVGLVTDVTEEKTALLQSEGIRQRLEESSARYRPLFDSSAAAIFTLDSEGCITGGNATGQKLSGFFMRDLAGKNFVDFIMLKEREQANEHFLSAMAGEVKDRRLKFTFKSDISIVCLVKFIPINPESKKTGFYMIIKDMTELDRIASLYQEGAENFRIIAENVHDVIILMDRDKNYLYVSPSVETIYGYKADGIVGQKPFYNVHPDDVDFLQQAFNEAAEKRTPYLMQLRLLHKNKGWVWSEINGTPVFDEEDRFNHMVMVARDISIQKEYESQLKHFAYFDSLTELPNRRNFQEYAKSQLELNERCGKSLAVLILDIDDFKEINDQWGHETGDAVIQEFGFRLNSCIQGENMAARLGGDEFVILLADTESKEQVAEIADQIYRVMEKPIEVQGLSLKISISMGIALAPAEEVSVSVMMKRADMAMYKAKKQEKNSFHVSPA